MRNVNGGGRPWRRAPAKSAVEQRWGAVARLAAKGAAGLVVAAAGVAAGYEATTRGLSAPPPPERLSASAQAAVWKSAGLTTAEKEAAFGQGPYAIEAVELLAVPAFRVLARVHPAAAHALYLASGYPELDAVARVRALEGAGGVEAIRAFADAVAPQLPRTRYAAIDGGAGQDFIVLEGRLPSQPALHVMPAPRLDNTNFSRPAAGTRGLRGQDPTPVPGRFEIAPERIVLDASGRRATAAELARLLVFGTHGMPWSFGDLTVSEAAELVARAITQRAAEKTSPTIAYVYLDACDTSTQLLPEWLTGPTVAAAFDAAINGALAARGHAPVTVLATDGPGMTDPGAWQKTVPFTATYVQRNLVPVAQLTPGLGADGAEFLFACFGVFAALPFGAAHTADAIQLARNLRRRDASRAVHDLSAPRTPV